MRSFYKLHPPPPIKKKNKMPKPLRGLGIKFFFFGGGEWGGEICSTNFPACRLLCWVVGLVAQSITANLSFLIYMELCQYPTLAMPQPKQRKFLLRYVCCGPFFFCLTISLCIVGLITFSDLRDLWEPLGEFFKKVADVRFVSGHRWSYSRFHRQKLKKVNHPIKEPHL